MLRETTKDERLGETKVRPEERPKEEKSREVSKPKKESKDKRLGVTKERLETKPKDERLEQKQYTSLTFAPFLAMEPKGIVEVP